MKLSRLFVILEVTLIVLGFIASTAGKSYAESQSITRTFSGFAFEKSELNLGMKSQIKSWAQANPDYTVASCVGFTGQNVKKRSQAFLQKLATSRAKNICNYIHSLNGVVTIYSTQGIPGNGKTAAARRVKVTLYKTSSDNGNSVVSVGVCDSSLNVVMRSRWSQDSFYFSSMTIRDIASNCKGNVLDVYLLDKDGNQLASSLDNKISRSFLRLSFALFDNQNVESNTIAKVAFELRKP